MNAKCDRVITIETATKILRHAYEVAFSGLGNETWLAYSHLRRNRRTIAMYGAIKSLIPGFHLLMLRHEGVDLIYAGSRVLAQLGSVPQDLLPTSALPVLLQVIAAGFRTKLPAIQRFSPGEAHSSGQQMPEFPDDVIRWICAVLRGMRARKLLLGFMPVIGTLLGAWTDLAVFDRMSREARLVVHLDHETTQGR